MRVPGDRYVRLLFRIPRTWPQPKILGFLELHAIVKTMLMSILLISAVPQVTKPKMCYVLGYTQGENTSLPSRSYHSRMGIVL